MYRTFPVTEQCRSVYSCSGQYKFSAVSTKHLRDWYGRDWWEEDYGYADTDDDDDDHDSGGYTASNGKTYVDYTDYYMSDDYDEDWHD